MPKLCQGDKVRAHLNMDRGELRFSLCKADEGWKEIPHVITGIQCPVVAACCIQVPPLSPVPRPAPPRPAPACPGFHARSLHRAAPACSGFHA